MPVHLRDLVLTPVQRTSVGPLWTNVRTGLPEHAPDWTISDPKRRAYRHRRLSGVVAGDHLDFVTSECARSGHERIIQALSLQSADRACNLGV